MGTGSSAERLLQDTPASMATHEVDGLAALARSGTTFALPTIRLPKRPRGVGLGPPDPVTG
jgi:hypothetical protein